MTWTVTWLFLGIFIGGFSLIFGRIPQYHNPPPSLEGKDEMERGINLPESNETIEFLLQLASEFHESDGPRSLTYTYRALSLAEKLDNRYGEARARYWLSWHLGADYGTVRTGITEALKSIEILKNLNEAYWLARTLELAASNYFFLDKGDGGIYKDSALSCLDAALHSVHHISNQSSDSIHVLAEIYSTYAWVYEFDSLKHDSIRYFLEHSILLFDSVKDRVSAADDRLFLATIFGDQGETHKDWVQFEKAGPLFLQAIDRFDSLKLKGKLSQAYFFYARWLIQEYQLTATWSSFENGISNYHKSLEIDSSRLCDTYCGIGFAYFDKSNKEKRLGNLNWQGSRDSAIYYYQKALSLVEQESNSTCLDNIANQLVPLCVGDKECTDILEDLIEIYQSMHRRDVEKLEEENLEIRQFQQKTQEREAQLQRMRLMGIGVGILLGLLAIFSILYQRQRIKNLRKQLNLELAALRAQMNPHFISNSLNAIENLIHEEEPQKAANYLIEFSHLCRIILNQSRDEEITVGKEIEILGYILSLEKLRLQDKLNYSLDLDPKIDSSQIRIPPMIIQPFVENAIWHGIHPQDKGGNLIVSIQQRSKSELVCIVEDDGIGRAKSKERKKDSVFGRKSWGLKITEERIKAIQKIKGASLHIEDLVSEDGYSLGTRVTIVIPI